MRYGKILGVMVLAPDHWEALVAWADSVGKGPTVVCGDVISTEVPVVERIATLDVLG